MDIENCETTLNRIVVYINPKNHDSSGEMCIYTLFYIGFFLYRK